MKIAIVSPSFYPAIVYGGTIKASLDYANLLAELGHSIFVSTTNTNKTSRLKVECGKFIEFKKNLFIKYYNETIIDKVSLPLLVNIKEDIYKAELVHIHAIFNTPIPVSLYFARKYKKPVILSAHGVLGEWIMKNGSPFKKVWLNIFVRPFANEVLWHATSLQERKEILSHFPNAKITTIPLPIDLSPYKENKTAKNFYNRFYSHHLPNPLIIISMGRLQKKKGFDILIRSFNNTLSKFPQLLLFIAGEDEGEKAPLEKLIQELNLKEKVFFTGVLQGEDKIAFLQNADLFVLPSHNENFGLVYLEALAAGTPIVASKETPWQEVEDYGCGKWVNNTVEETSEAIVEMLSRKDPEVREKARKLAEKYSMDNVRKILASTLDDLTKNV